MDEVEDGEECGSGENGSVGETTEALMGVRAIWRPVRMPFLSSLTCNGEDWMVRLITATRGAVEHGEVAKNEADS